jgi:hypothetical protein
MRRAIERRRIAFNYGGDNPLVINRTGTGSFVFDNLGEDAVIAVERSMYWDADGRFWAGGSNALASIVPR